MGEESDGPSGGERSDPLLAWGLASFHAALLVVLPIAAAHAIDPRAMGDLLGGLGTGVGFALYLVLWGATWWSNRRWLRESDFDAPRRTVVAGARWGAPTGLAVLAALVVVLLVDVNPIFAALVAVVGGLLSLLIGAAVGALLAALDVILYRAAGTIADRASGSPDGTDRGDA